MSKVLKTDASAADAWVEIDIGTPQPEIWVTYDLYFDPASLALMLSSGGAWLSMIYPIAEADPTTDAFGVSGGGWAPGPDAPSGGVWMTVEHHHLTADSGDVYIDGVLLVSPSDFAASDADRVRIGQYNTFGVDPSFVYFDNVKVGTTRGASDLFSDDFESGNLSAWTTTSGAVSIVDYPFVTDATVTFDANGGSGAMASQVASSPAALTANSFTRPGFTFAGWNTSPGGGGTAYADGAIYPFGADVTLYAQWAPLPPPAKGPLEGVCLALDDVTLEPDPDWTRLDTYPGVSVQEWQIDRGRKGELEKTGTGTATVKILDKRGVLDPTNPTSPFYDLDLAVTKLDPMKQAGIALQDPVTDEWSGRFRGFLASLEYDMDISEGFGMVTLEFVDAFDILAALEMTPGHHGDTPPSEVVPNIYFNGGSTIYTTVNVRVDARLIKALNDGGWPAVMRRIFSGNVRVQDKIYARRDQLLTVLFDGADSEFPGVANVYVSKDGIVTFHGRYARFNPTVPQYRIHTWKAGDGAAVLADANTALISGLTFRRSKDDIINNVTALPEHFGDGDVPGSLVKDDDSIARFGWRSESFENLGTFRGHDDAGDYTVSALDETKKIAQYYVGNYKDPKTRVTMIRFVPRNAAWRDGPATWRLHCGVEIGDLIPLKTTHPGGGGFDEDFYVEGIHQTLVPMQEGMHQVTTELDVSPRSFYAYNPFNPDDAPVTNDPMAGANVMDGLSGTEFGDNSLFSNEGGDPVAATSKDPLVFTWSSLFTGPGGDYGNEAGDTHNFRSAWFRWTAPIDWSASSSFAVTLHPGTPGTLLLLKAGVSGVPPDNGDFTALGSGGAVNPPADTSDLTQTETGDAVINAGDVIYIGIGALTPSGDPFSFDWTYTP